MVKSYLLKAMLHLLYRLRPWFLLAPYCSAGPSVTASPGVATLNDQHGTHENSRPTDIARVETTTSRRSHDSDAHS